MESDGYTMGSGYGLAHCNPGLPVRVCQGYLSQPFLADRFILTHPPRFEALSLPGHPHLNPGSSFTTPGQLGQSLSYRLFSYNFQNPSAKRQDRKKRSGNGYFFV